MLKKTCNFQKISDEEKTFDRSKKIWYFYKDAKQEAEYPLSP